MKKVLSLFSLLGLVLPSLTRADCVPTAPVGYWVPFKMVSMKNFSSGGSTYASFTTGYLSYTAHSFIFSGTTLSSTGNQQLFSDRTLPINCGIFNCAQPFSLNNADQLGVAISDGTLLTFPIQPARISVTFTLQSWGNATETHTAACDATSGELFMSTSTGMYVLTFGVPQPPIG